MPTIDQVTEARLEEIRDLVRSGVTEHTGRAMRTAQEEGGEATGKRFRGLKHAYPELYRLPWSPSEIAWIIEHPKGPRWETLYETVRDAMANFGFQAPRPRSRGPLVIAPHEGRIYCHHCREYHAKSEHRAHGKGSFHRTHLFSFGKNPMCRKNPPREKSLDLIYRRVLSVQAQKLDYHRHCDAECKRANHKYNHDFKPGALLLGIPDGAFLMLPDGRTVRLSNGSMLISDKEY